MICKYVEIILFGYNATLKNNHFFLIETLHGVGDNINRLTFVNETKATLILLLGFFSLFSLVAFLAPAPIASPS